MSEIDDKLRYRYTANIWYTYILLALIIVSIVSLGWAYEINFNPEVEQQEELVGLWSESTDLEHKVEIKKDSMPFKQGSVVENRPIYYTSLSEDLEGEYTYSYTANNGSVDIKTDVYMELKGVKVRDQQVVDTYWNVIKPLGSQTSENINPSDTHKVDFDINVPSTQEELSKIQDQLNSTKGELNISVITVSKINGQVNGNDVSNRYTTNMSIVADENTYEVVSVNTLNKEHRIKEERQVVTDPPLVQSVISVLLSVIFVLITVGFVLSKRLGYLKLSDKEREKMEIHRSKEQFSEWITSGEFPSDKEYEQTVLVNDLEGLVDVAIDTNKRVIEDEQLEVSTVLDDEYVYIYIHPGSPAEEWLTGFADDKIDSPDDYDF